MSHTNNVTFSLQSIEERPDGLIDKLVELWYASVCASHKFLAESDINEIRECLPNMFVNIQHLIVASDKNGNPLAFMGVEDGMLEMLFVSPTHFGIGIGRKLVEFGIDNLAIERVTVNEQNPDAIGFYEHLGFRRYHRTECDTEGRPFPLIFMRYNR